MCIDGGAVLRRFAGRSLRTLVWGLAPGLVGLGAVLSRGWLQGWFAVGTGASFVLLFDLFIGKKERRGRRFVLAGSGLAFGLALGFAGWGPTVTFLLGLALAGP